ncbi:MAG: hypothetical protein KBS43_04630 [Oscillospiraceae bacterium]|nr:hypothetical protein [Candidatus Limimonas coprohippi]
MKTIEFIEFGEAVCIIEDKQRELCPRGRFSRRYLDGTDRDTFDMYQEMIDTLCALPRYKVEVHE